jgi:hypothetical protein
MATTCTPIRQEWDRIPASGSDSHGYQGNHTTNWGLKAYRANLHPRTSAHITCRNHHHRPYQSITTSHTGNSLTQSSHYRSTPEPRSSRYHHSARTRIPCLIAGHTVDIVALLTDTDVPHFAAPRIAGVTIKYDTSLQSKGPPRRPLKEERSMVIDDRHPRQHPPSPRRVSLFRYTFTRFSRFLSTHLARHKARKPSFYRHPPPNNI